MTPGYENKEQALLERLRCPTCGGALEPGSNAGEPVATCGECGATYSRVLGIWRMLTPEQEKVYGRFLAGYRELRQREGWVRNEAYYLSLPEVPPDDPTAGIWRIRRRSLAILERELGQTPGGWALDLGAGCGWLSRRLAALGYITVASDLNADGPDGLQGVSIYSEHDHTWIGRVQASMDCLPFADDTFDLCAASASLHYASLEQTLKEVNRILRPGQTLLITDSPLYADADAGKTMAAEQRARAQEVLGTPPAPLPGGEGYFQEEQLISALKSSGFQPRLVRSENAPARVKEFLRTSLVPGSREHAHFPVVIATKSRDTRVPN